jgi:hypothetical protein
MIQILGGSCKNVPQDETLGYECLCHERFVGSQCELDTDPCASQPCLYGGVCNIVEEGRIFFNAQIFCIRMRITIFKVLLIISFVSLRF